MQYSTLFFYMNIANLIWTAVPYRRHWLRNIVVFFTILSLIIVIYTFSEEAELDGSTGKQDMA